MRTLSLAALISGWCFVCAAEVPEVTLDIGDAAPVFEAMNDQKELWRSSDHFGKKIVVVYFYPADLTGGCTKQACGFRDDYEKLKNAEIEVVGVSGDSVENHQLFKKVHALNFALLADEDGKVARAFGVPVRDGATISKNVNGVEHTLKRGVTASRWTFVIGLDGKVLYKNTSVEAAEDSKRVLEVVRGQLAAK